MDKKAQSMKGGLSTLLGENKPRKVEAPAEERKEAPGEAERYPEEGAELREQIADEEFKAALHAKRLEKRGRPRKGERKAGEIGYSRATFVVNEEKLAKIREIALRETLLQKDIIEAAFDLIIARYEEEHGEIIPEEDKAAAFRAKFIK